MRSFGNGLADAYHKFVNYGLICITIIFRGINCGYTKMSVETFTKTLKKLQEYKFRVEDYKLFENNCRDFCYYLIFDVLIPSKKEAGM